MPEVIKTYRQKISGALRFIGKKYSSGREAWKNWDNDNKDNILEKHINGINKGLFDDSEYIIGFMCESNGNFEYWLGYFTPENTPVPEGFECIDLPKMDLGVGWIYGKDSEVYAKEKLVWHALAKEGYKIITGYFFERYVYNRCEVPDDNGNIIIDICFFVE